LKANAIAVVSDLGGGHFGHLGLVLSPVEYDLISDIPYVRPAHPGALIIPHGAAHHEAVRLREENQENIRLFRETIQVEKALIKQIVASIDPEYLKELRDDATSTITLDIPAILQHLFLHYGQVDSDVLDREEQKLKNYMWNINDPPVRFFNLVEELSQLSIAANLQKSEQQIVGIGLDIVRRTGDFEKGLIGWLARPVVEHTWPNFKQHFNAAYRKLKRIRGPAMHSTAFRQAHQVVTDLSRDFTQMRDEVMAVMNSVTMMQDGAAINDDTDSNPPAIDTPAPLMNATIDKDILLAIKKTSQRRIEVQ